MQTWHIGRTTVTRIEELMGPMFDPVRFFPDHDPAVFEKHKDWLYPLHKDPEGGNIVASMHSWLIQTPHHNILIDTCLGNDKDRMPYRDWHQLKTPWLDRLRATGVSPDAIDYVMCTHLHVDHVGWNTQLVNGQWVPTFPNANYVFSKQEFDFWNSERNKAEPATFNEVNNKTFDDSVLPILDLAQMIDADHELLSDMLHIEMAPGHTPGSIAIGLHDQGKRAVFSGDICHHPIQVYEPDWNSAYCETPDQAIATRKRILTQCCDQNALLMPAHFGPSHTGYVRASDNSFMMEWTEPG